MLYAELEPFGMDEADFRAMTLNGLVAGIVGAKIPPESFTLRHFIDQIHAEAAADDDVVAQHEAHLDQVLGVARVPSLDEKQVDSLLRVN